MAHGFHTKLPYKTGYPGNGYYYVYCDVCGKKVRAKDTVKVNDKYSTQFNLVICHKDADITNPQAYIKAFRERQIDTPSLIRSEPQDRYVYVSDPDNIDSGASSSLTVTLASPPQYPEIIGASTSSITLIWKGPEAPGSSPITGYRIQRESPVGGGFSVLTTTTSPATYYEDDTVASNTQYNYKIAAVSIDGVGSYSTPVSTTTNAS